MQSVISLAAYAVKVSNPTDREYEVISNFDGDGADLFDFLHDTLQGIKDKTLDQVALQQAMSVPKLEKNNRTLSGIIETGQYGHESNIIDVKKATVVYKRKKDDAEMLPFYFYLDIPEGTEDGILVLQRTGAIGIRKLLYWVLSIAFEEKYPEFRLKLPALVAESEVERFMKGKIQKIHFIKKSIPADIADAYDKGHQETHGTLDLVIRASKGGILPMNGWLSNIFKKRKVDGLLTLDDGEKFGYDNVKAQVKLGRAIRTINVAEPGRIRSYFDVTDELVIGSNGHPEYDSIQGQTEKLVTGLRTLLYG